MRACALLLVLAACGQQYHVRLDPPRPGITPEERVALFWKRRPTQEGFVTSDGELLNQTLILGDKQPGVDEVEVVSPEDLEPLVGPNSETMQHARRSIVPRNKARQLSHVAIAVLVGGFVAGIALDQRDTTGGPPWGWITFGTTAATSTVLYVLARRATREELVWRKRAFSTYTRDLGTMLDVCAHGTKVVPCEAPVDEPSEPKAPATTQPGRTALLRMR
jgi:hypothetical protein